MSTEPGPTGAMDLLQDELRRMLARLSEQDERLSLRRAELDAREDRLRGLESRLEQERLDLTRAAARLSVDLERAAGMSRREARAALLAEAEVDARRDLDALHRRTESAFVAEADRRLREVIARGIERCAAGQTSESTVTVVALPSNEMKGRLIGREGRNVRAFETLTGVSLLIDDTPEAVVVSCFDPIRREVARLALERLIADGRIHPPRIESYVESARVDLEAGFPTVGAEAAARAGVVALHPFLLERLGRLKYRTSYGQNALEHSVEVSRLASAMAEDLGIDTTVSRRAGLLHDIGKAADPGTEGAHLSLSVEWCRTYGEAEAVVAVVAAHHGDLTAPSLEAAIVRTADAVSSARPGARRAMLEEYLQRMSALEKLGASVPGVERCYAVEAGRELRILVSPEAVDDRSAVALAAELARRIEQEMRYPGEIRVTVIREFRAADIAK